MNYNNIFAFIRQQKAFTAFMTTLVVLGSVSAVFAARGASAETVFKNVKYTLADPKANTLTQHTIEFFNINQITAGTPNGILLTYTGSPFAGMSSILAADVAMTSVKAGATTTYNGVSSCSSGAEFTVTAAAGSLAIKPCIAIPDASNVKIVLSAPAVANKLTNPVVAVPTAYDVMIAHPATNQSQKVKVMVLPSNIAMTAVVDPIFTFSIASTTVGSTVNGTTTTFTTKDDQINFGTLVPNVASIGAQKLTVSTNAINGFTVTAQTDAPFKSENGATIDPFNLTSSSTAIGWVAPEAKLNDDKTWGHIGLTASTISSGKYVGNFIMNPVVVLTNASSTRDASSTVGYVAQISDLQEAATDYKTNVIYVATPQF